MQLFHLGLLGTRQACNLCRLSFSVLVSVPNDKITIDIMVLEIRLEFLVSMFIVQMDPSMWIKNNPKEIRMLSLSHWQWFTGIINRWSWQPKQSGERSEFRSNSLACLTYIGNILSNHNMAISSWVSPIVRFPVRVIRFRTHWTARARQKRWRRDQSQEMHRERKVTRK